MIFHSATAAHSDRVSVPVTKQGLSVFGLPYLLVLRYIHDSAVKEVDLDKSFFSASFTDLPL